jgi:precorrin-2 dehydrogenase/sirohydrochlorin ferrochelatase
LVLNTLKTKPELSRTLLRLATREGFLLNCHDQPLCSNFIMPAIVQRGSLQIGITTGGASPSISKRLREDLEKLFDGEFTAFLDWLAKMRRDLLKSGIPPQKRIELLRKVTRDFTLSGKIRYPKAWRRQAWTYPRSSSEQI